MTLSTKPLLLFLLLSAASCDAASGRRHPHPSLTTSSSVRSIPRGGGGGSIDADALVTTKSVLWGSTGVMAPAVNVFQAAYEIKEPLKEGTIKGYCAEAFCWSAMDVAILSYMASRGAQDNLNRALAVSALPTLFLYYKETLKGTYPKIGWKAGAGLSLLTFLAACVASMMCPELGLDGDLAAKLLIGLTYVSCGVSAFLPEVGASWKGVTLKKDEIKWWSWANKMPLEWAALATCLKRGVEPNKAVGYATLVWAALLTHSKLNGQEIVGRPIVSTMYALYSLVTGYLLGFSGGNGNGGGE